MTDTPVKAPPKAKPPEDTPKSRALARLAALATDLGLTEAQVSEAIRTHTGCGSADECTAPQLGKLLEALERNRPQVRPTPAQTSQA